MRLAVDPSENSQRLKGRSLGDGLSTMPTCEPLKHLIAAALREPVERQPKWRQG